MEKYFIGYLKGFEQTITNTKPQLSTPKINSSPQTKELFDSYNVVITTVIITVIGVGIAAFISSNPGFVGKKN